MQVRGQVTETREIDLVRMQGLAQRCLGGEYRVHEARALGGREIGHFRDVPVEDHSTQSRIVALVHQNDAAELIPPEKVSTRRIAQFTGVAGQCYTQSRPEERRAGSLACIRAKHSRTQNRRT